MSAPVVRRCICAFFLSVVLAPFAAANPGQGNSTVIIIRHADKPDVGDGLSRAGEARAEASAAYFQNFKFRSAPVKLDAVFAAADSKNSRRPRLTVEPLARALGLAVDTSYKNKDFLSLADAIRTRQGGKGVLVCWHHGEMPELLQALGAKPDALLPHGRWPDDEYRWFIVLRYDANGSLDAAQRGVEPF